MWDFFCSIMSGVPGADQPRKPVPINMAEAVIEPFWDPGLSGFDEWKIPIDEMASSRIT